jgi:hypothetical protein
MEKKLITLGLRNIKNEINCWYVWFEVLTAMVTQSFIFWDIKPCILLKVSQCFRGIHCLHLQSWRISQSSITPAKACCRLHTGFLLDLLFNPEDGSHIFLWNVHWLSTDHIALYPRRQNSLLFLFEKYTGTGSCLLFCSSIRNKSPPLCPPSNTNYHSIY